MAGKLIVLSAPSGSGKTTIGAALLKDITLRLVLSVSATSRSPRGSEINGKDYYFFSLEEFKDKIKHGHFLEFEEVYAGQFYGTLKSEIERITSEEKNVLLDVDVEGALQIKKMYPERCVTLFIRPPSLEELERRLRARGTDDEASIKKRLGKAETELAYAKHFDFVFENGNLEESLQQIKSTLAKILCESI